MTPHPNDWRGKSPDEIRADIEIVLNALHVPTLEPWQHRLMAQFVTGDRRVHDPKLRPHVTMIGGPISGRMADSVFVDDPWSNGIRAPWDTAIAAGKAALHDNPEYLRILHGDGGHIGGLLGSTPPPEPPHPGHMSRQRRRWLARKGNR
jgi:hypothetical protein